MENKMKKGFTIIETLVATAILMIAITGPLTISQKGLGAAVYARDQLVATYLAQDAMEYVHYLRDKNILSGSTYNTGMTACATVTTGADVPGGCTIDTYSNGALKKLDHSSSNFDFICQYNESSIPDVPLMYDHGNQDNGNCSSGSTAHLTTQFHRRIYIDPVSGANNGHESAVKVVVTWSNGSLDNTVTLKDNIYDR